MVEVLSAALFDEVLEAKKVKVPLIWTLDPFSGGGASNLDPGHRGGPL